MQQPTLACHIFGAEITAFRRLCLSMPAESNLAGDLPALQ